MRTPCLVLDTKRQLYTVSVYPDYIVQPHPISSRLRLDTLRGLGYYEQVTSQFPTKSMTT